MFFQLSKEVERLNRFTGYYVVVVKSYILSRRWQNVVKCDDNDDDDNNFSVSVFTVQRDSLLDMLQGQYLYHSLIFIRSRLNFTLVSDLCMSLGIISQSLLPRQKGLFSIPLRFVFLCLNLTLPLLRRCIFGLTLSRKSPRLLSLYIKSIHQCPSCKHASCTNQIDIPLILGLWYIVSMLVHNCLTCIPLSPKMSGILYTHVSMLCLSKTFQQMKRSSRSKVYTYTSLFLVLRFVSALATFVPHTGASPPVAHHTWVV